MFFAKQQFIVSFLLFTFTNFIVTIDGGRIYQQTTQNSVIRNVESNWDIPNISFEKPYEEPYEEPYRPEVKLTKDLSEGKFVVPSTVNIGNTTLALDTRNNFGDLPKKCGPNEERIHGECREV